LSSARPPIPLTGLANRRAFEARLEARLADGSPDPFSVLMLDVDDLKQVNDAQGHVAGDAVLKQVAAVLRSHLRQEDLVTRWGGDEFVLLMPGVDRVGAISLARQHRRHAAGGNGWDGIDLGVDGNGVLPRRRGDR